MITAYLAGIPSGVEGEDIEIRYSINDDNGILCKKSFYKDYVKPVLVSLKAMGALCEELKNYDTDDITILINDAALNELIKGTSTTSNKEVLRLSSMVRRKLQNFSHEITVKDVSINSSEIMLWSEALTR
ncbi:MAG: hypothetical protein HGA49_07225 [Eubacteriaceae bacterium]|nr:hypothetical protein [Eubacteriaceae bacterium]